MTRIGFEIVSGDGWVKAAIRALLGLAVALILMSLFACGGVKIPPQVPTDCRATVDAAKAALDTTCALDARGDACKLAKLAWATADGACPATTKPPEQPPVVAPPPVVPPVVPPVTPPEVPPVVACASESDLTVNEVQRGQQLQSKVASVLRALGDPTGLDPHATLERVAAKLRETGLCAFAGSEAVFVRCSDQLFEEWHCVFFGDGSWTNSGQGRFIGVHRLKSSPVASYPCPTPCPARTYDDGRPRFAINTHPHSCPGGSCIDSTPVVVDQLAFCESIGMGEMGGKPRASCPLGADLTPERQARERWILAGGPVWEVDHGTVVSMENAFDASCNGCTKLRVCATDKLVCSDWTAAP